MKTFLITWAALLSFTINAGLFPAANGSYTGTGLVTSNFNVDNAEYQAQIIVGDTSILATTTDDNGRVANLSYDLVPTGEGFFALTISLIYNNGSDDLLHATGIGLGNCNYGVCHFNGEIDDVSNGVEKLFISDVFSFDVDGEISRRAALDFDLKDDDRSISYALSEITKSAE